MHLKLVQKLLISHDLRFARHGSINQFIFNQKIHHETNLKFSIRVKGNDKRTRKLTKLFNEDDFQERLMAAANDPMGEDARWISKSVLPFLKIVGSQLRNSPFAIRMCYCSQDIELELPELVVRTKLLAENSVVAARVYQRLMRGFFDIICGIPLSHFTGRKSNIDRLLSKNQSGYIGAFGKLKAVYSVTEEQTGGSLHMHGQLFGMIDQRV